MKFFKKPEKRLPYEEFVKNTIKSAIKNSELLSLLKGDKPEYNFHNKHTVSDGPNNYPYIMRLLVEISKEIDLNQEMQKVFLQLLNEDDINMGLFIIDRIMLWYYYIKHEDAFEISEFYIDFSPIFELYKEKLLENKESLINDTRYATEYYGSKQGLWEPIKRTNNSLNEEYADFNFKIIE